MERIPPKLVAFCRELEGKEVGYGLLDVIGVYKNKGAHACPDKITQTAAIPEKVSRKAKKRILTQTQD